jgi:hypothetical protein
MPSIAQQPRLPATTGCAKSPCRGEIFLEQKKEAQKKISQKPTTRSTKTETFKLT